MHKLIKPYNMSDETRMAFVEEAEAQGCHIRTAPMNPLILHGTKRRAYLFYIAWPEHPRTMRHIRTLWPKRLPESWKENGIPGRAIARPIPHPQRLLDILNRR